MKGRIRNTLITACTAGTIAVTIAPAVTEPPPGWSKPLKTVGIVLAAAGMVTILTDED